MKQGIRLILTLLLTVVLILPCHAQAETNQTYVYDTADLLSSMEEERLTESLSDLSDTYGIYVAVALVPDHTGNLEQYADRLYRDLCNGSSNGAIFLLSMEERDWWIKSYGTVQTAYTEDALDRIEETCIPYMSEADYYEGFLTFIHRTQEMMELQAQGTPYKAPLPMFEIILLALIPSFIIALIVVLIMKGKLKSVRRQDSAREYMKRDSLQITESRDLFLYRTVSRTPKPKSNSGSSGSSGGGSRGGKF